MDGVTNNTCYGCGEPLNGAVWLIEDESGIDRQFHGKCASAFIKRLTDFKKAQS